MPVIRQSFITRMDLHNNRQVLYVFGDNEIGKGLGGQAKEMRGEPNAVGIPTKKKPSMSDDAFFNDDDFDRVAPLISVRIQRLIRHLETGGIVIFPADGIGTGRAELAERAPMIHDFLRSYLVDLFSHYPARNT